MKQSILGYPSDKSIWPQVETPNPCKSEIGHSVIPQAVLTKILRIKLKLLVQEYHFPPKWQEQVAPGHWCSAAAADWTWLDMIGRSTFFLVTTFLDIRNVDLVSGQWQSLVMSQEWTGKEVQHPKYSEIRTSAWLQHACAQWCDSTARPWAANGQAQGRSGPDHSGPLSPLPR